MTESKTNRIGKKTNPTDIHKSAGKDMSNQNVLHHLINYERTMYPFDVYECGQVNQMCNLYRT